MEGDDGIERERRGRGEILVMMSYRFGNVAAMGGAAAGGSPPVADFSGTPLAGPKDLSVTFTDLSTNSPTSWSWEKSPSLAPTEWVPFESEPTVQNPTEEFTEEIWNIRLTATNAAGSDDETKNNYIASEP